MADQDVWLPAIDWTKWNENKREEAESAQDRIAQPALQNSFIGKVARHDITDHELPEAQRHHEEGGLGTDGRDRETDEKLKDQGGRDE